jgi:hypothetical protein
MPGKHTPGPWKAWTSKSPFKRSGVNGLTEAGDAPFTICIMGTPNKLAETHANARLIAAAPEMLEALRAVVEEFERPHDSTRNLPSVMRAARAAIAKATLDGQAGKEGE